MITTEEIYNIIKEEFTVRNMRWPPNAWESLGWATTELGEVYEQMLAKSGGYVRNNPDDHPGFQQERFAEELADIIFMILVTGIITNCDPLEALMIKAARKIEAAKRSKTEDDWDKSSK